MIVYVESNFILELAYVREEHASCERILTLSEERKVVVVLPAFCLGEPYESWVRRSRDRRALLDRFAQEIRELSRSQPYSTLLKESQDITRTLIQSGEEEKQRLDAIIGRVIDTAEIIPIERDTIKAAIRLQGERSLSPQDAIVYASVLSHMARAESETKCFLTKNSKDFANPDIYEDLKAFNCKLLTSFDNGLSYLRSQVPS
jgi:predicted nucleic acid-binding protein